MKVRASMGRFNISQKTPSPKVLSRFEPNLVRGIRAMRPCQVLHPVWIRLSKGTRRTSNPKICLCKLSSATARPRRGAWWVRSLIPLLHYIFFSIASGQNWNETNFEAWEQCPEVNLCSSYGQLCAWQTCATGSDP